MFWAIDPETGGTVQASPGLTAECPVCGAPVRSRTGELVTWHFAHRRFSDCDYWSEPEGKWHFDWKSCVPPNMREVRLERTVLAPGREPEPWVHRADVLNSRGTVVELQSSGISPDQIKDRELFYVNMIWLFNATTYASRFSFRRGVQGHDFVWSFPHKTLFTCKSPVFFDFGRRDLFLVKKMGHTSPSHGWGHFIDKKEFKKIYMV